MIRNRGREVRASVVGSILSRALSIAVAVAVLAGIGVATGAIPESGTGVVHLCYQRGEARGDKGGAELRVYDASANQKGCTTGDATLTMNQTGPAGSPGPQGIPGPQGPRGPQGAPGSASDDVTLRRVTANEDDSLNLPDDHPPDQIANPETMVSALIPGGLWQVSVGGTFFAHGSEPQEAATVRCYLRGVGPGQPIGPNSLFTIANQRPYHAPTIILPIGSNGDFNGYYHDDETAMLDFPDSLNKVDWSCAQEGADGVAATQRYLSAIRIRPRV